MWTLQEFAGLFKIPSIVAVDIDKGEGAKLGTHHDVPHCRLRRPTSRPSPCRDLIESPPPRSPDSATAFPSPRCARQPFTSIRRSR